MPTIRSYEYEYSTSYQGYLSRFSSILLPEVKTTLRRHDDKFDKEISSYIETAAEDLKDAGIHISYFLPQSDNWICDSRILQAVRWYCLSVFGLYNPDMEKYDKAYRSLKATLCTQKKYTENIYAL